MNAYDELIDVIATGPAAERILQFRASDENASPARMVRRAGEQATLVSRSIFACPADPAMLVVQA